MMGEAKKPWEEVWTAEIHSNACECSSRMVVTTDREHTIPGDEEYFYANDGGRANYMGARLQLAAAAPELYRALDDLLHAHDRGAVPLRSDVLEAMDRAEAALRKARGEP